MKPYVEFKGHLQTKMVLAVEGGDARLLGFSSQSCAFAKAALAATLGLAGVARVGVKNIWTAG